MADRSPPARDISSRLQALQEEIAELTPPDRTPPRIVAVTKYVESDLARAVVEAGHAVLGESRVESLRRKAEDLAGLEVEWHFIGHLQRNKARQAAGLIDWIHSLDSASTVHTLDSRLADVNRRAMALVQVNLTGESAKSGVDPSGVSELIDVVRAAENLEFRGLMTMGPTNRDSDETRRVFAALRTLAEGIGRDCLELSMGMSGDWRLAVEEGATMLRLGSVLFDGVSSPSHTPSVPGASPQ